MVVQWCNFVQCSAVLMQYACSTHVTYARHCDFRNPCHENYANMFATCSSISSVLTVELEHHTHSLSLAHLNTSKPNSGPTQTFLGQNEPQPKQHKRFNRKVFSIPCLCFFHVFPIFHCDCTSASIDSMTKHACFHNRTALCAVFIVPTQPKQEKVELYISNWLPKGQTILVPVIVWFCHGREELWFGLGPTGHHLAAWKM